MSWYHAFPEWSCLWPTFKRLDMDATPCERCGTYIAELERQAEVAAATIARQQAEIERLISEKQAASVKTCNDVYCGIYRVDGHDTKYMGD